MTLYLNKSILNKEETIPWSSLKYLIGEAMYGGRVTDEYDRRVINTYMDEYMGEFILDTNNKFYFGKTKDFNYEIIKYQEIDELIKKVNEFPLFNPPNLFGLHQNAEIIFFSQQAKQLMKDILSL